MFSPALGRVARSTSSISTRPTAALSAAQQTFSRRPQQHQRRLSSSKTSIPPDGSESRGSTQQNTSNATNKATPRKLTGRAGKKRGSVSTGAAAAANTAAAPTINVPHVPPTDFLQKPELKISSFFSLHRPISITSPVPPITTNASFDTIFQARALNNKKVMMDNIQTLESGIEGIEVALRSQGQKQGQEEVIQSEAEVKHLDGAPPASVDQLMSHFLPFKPPPAPVPWNQSPESSLASTQPQEEPEIQTAPVKQRAWSTAVIVTESVDASGNRTYSASTEPMVEIQVPAPENSQELDEIEIRQPFLERMRQRQNIYNRYRDTQGRPDMLLISVKRQRKLKMKKHKYKKLMKKTRLLRRKLDRA
ncbi:uncharacterized protein BDR25DRAFT_343333 [Lindgomyces ingoldianus]|uniref:Uncharacterized protein n=1 Tax=Lindgomyces ingoldianus TaxID=673940 RepID=A0ACB6QV32_9PLEO|nr:uncharacterized protein BDR25DRAFT_343333 [Lindgomyces ingoldianus]KAF2470112.1 hypothetical protein BDR25DRAFT_343333 [Lindgomyces ingoldianus]